MNTKTRRVRKGPGSRRNWYALTGRSFHSLYYCVLFSNFTYELSPPIPIMCGARIG